MPRKEVRILLLLLCLTLPSCLNPLKVTVKKLRVRNGRDTRIQACRVPKIIPGVQSFRISLRFAQEQCRRRQPAKLWEHVRYPPTVARMIVHTGRRAQLSGTFALAAVLSRLSVRQDRFLLERNGSTNLEIFAFRECERTIFTMHRLLSKMRYETLIKRKKNREKQRPIIYLFRPIIRFYRDFIPLSL